MHKTKACKHFLTLTFRVRIFKYMINFTFEYPPGLKAKENLELIKKYQQTHDESIKEKIILGNLRYISHYVHEHCSSFVDCICYGYPTYDDLNQIAILEVMKCIDQFDTSRGTAFSSYISQAIHNKCLMLIRLNKKSKNDLHYNDSLDASDDDSLFYIDKIDDKSCSPEQVSDQLEYRFILKQVLPYLTFREQYIIWQYYINCKSQYEIGELIHVSRSLVSRMLKAAVEKLSNFYKNGIDNISKKLRGVTLPTDCLKQFIRTQEFVEKHGENYLRDAFLPSLRPQEALAFQSGVLYYAGQNLKQLERDTGLSGSHFSFRLDDLEKNFGSISNVPPNPNQDKIDKIKSLVLKYGGAPFLTHYFLPTLNDSLRRAFTFGVLQFKGQITRETADFAKQTLPELKNNLESSIKQLKVTDFKKMIMKEIRHEQE